MVLRFSMYSAPMISPSLFYDQPLFSLIFEQSVRFLVGFVFLHWCLLYLRIWLGYFFEVFYGVLWVLFCMVVLRMIRGNPRRRTMMNHF